MTAYIAPEIRERFNTLSSDLQNCIIDRKAELYNIHDLIRVLEDIVEEGDM
jgi:hypothetical protein